MNTPVRSRPRHRLGPLRARAGPDQPRPRANGRHLGRVDPCRAPGSASGASPPPTRRPRRWRPSPGLRAIRTAGIDPDEIDLILAGHADARLLDAVDRGPGQGGDRQHPGRGDGRLGGVLRVRLRLRDRPGLHHERPGQARPGHRRRAADPVPRLHRPQHLHPVRRRRRRGRPVRVGRAGRQPGHRDDDRAAGRVHDLAAGRRCEEPALGRDDRPRRALHPDGRQGDLPVRHADAGLDRARLDPSAPGCDRATSPCSSRTRRTSGSSRPWPRASTCRWTGCSSTSTGTATPRPRRCRSPWPRRSTRAGSRSATGSSWWPSVPASPQARSRSSGPPIPPAASPATPRSGPRTFTSGCPVDWDSVDPIPEALAELMRRPGPVDVPLDDVVPGEPEHAHREVHA